MSTALAPRKRFALGPWALLAIAYVLAAVTLAAWGYHVAGPPGTEEDQALATGGLTVLTVFLGLPSLLMVLQAFARITGRTPYRRAAYVVVAVYALSCMVSTALVLSGVHAQHAHILHPQG